MHICFVAFFEHLFSLFVLQLPFLLLFAVLLAPFLTPHSICSPKAAPLQLKVASVMF